MKLTTKERWMLNYLKESSNNTNLPNPTKSYQSVCCEPH